MYYNKRLKIWATICLLSALSACVSQPVPVNINSIAHQQKLASLTNWRIEGRLAYKSPKEKKSASLNWHQDAQHFQLNLSSIFGTALLKMTGEPNYVVLEADGKQYQDTDPARLIWRTTGWKIPVSHFPQWIKGQSSNKDKTLFSADGLVKQIQSHCVSCKDWLINYEQYKLVDDLEVNSLWLPHRITLSNAATDSQIIIRVNQWTNN